jgi:hypothetical protein
VDQSSLGERHPAQVEVIENDQHQHHRGQGEGGDGGGEGHRPQLPEPVGLQEQTTQRLALEEGGRLRAQLGVVGLLLDSGADLGVRLPVGDLLQMDGDAVVA